MAAINLNASRRLSSVVRKPATGPAIGAKEIVTTRDNADLPGWTPTAAAEVPLLYAYLKSMTPKSINQQAPLPRLSQDARSIVFTHDSYYNDPKMHIRTPLEAVFPNKSLNTYEVSAGP